MIINLTQHQATPAQIEAGVVNDSDGGKYLSECLTFDSLPTREEIKLAAESLADYAASWAVDLGAPIGMDGVKAMIGGAPFLMGALEKALRKQGIQPVYAFSRRESVDQPQADGSIRKVAVFNHLGFVEA